MIVGNRTPILISVLVLAALLSFSTTTGTAAQSRVCRNLQAQLSAASSGGGSSASVRSQLSQAQGLANQKRCGALFGQRSKECQAINAKIGQLTNQLRSGGGGSAQSKKQIAAALKANGCGKKATKKTVKRAAPAKQQAAKPKAVAKPRAAAKPKAAAKRQAAVSPKAAAVAKAPARASTSRSSSARRKSVLRSGKTYRTMCVRLSDGYYFPISFSVPEKFFERDAETCQSRCAGMDVALYIHRPGEDSEEMVSYPEEEPYSDLGTAFIYRYTSMRSQASACRPAVEEAAEEPSVVVAFKGEVPIPTPRPSLEETSAIAGAPDADEQQASAATMDSAPKEKNIRVVGPRFLPDPSEKIDLKGPARPLGL